ncbi:ATP-binding protein [Gordonia jacobaea]|uniref:ATP-binding protein n=1 Tax=Gordonia jacobaea TaxID=122202 RepID=UPI0022E3ADB5|nr:AAA family ATPase [Gordonia jacobaea]
MTHATPPSDSTKPPKAKGQNKCREIADVWRDLGASPIPVKLFAQKEPDVTSWRQYQTTQPDSAQIEQWFGPKRGIGIVTGIGGIELLEFENEVPWTRWCRDMVDAGYADDLRKICDGYLAKSGGGGYHLIYRTDEPGGNVKLARLPKGVEMLRYIERDGAFKTSGDLIETRGVGGYVVVAGSDPDVHPTGQPYRRIRLPEHYVQPFPKLHIVVLDDDQDGERVVNAHIADDRAALSPAPDHLHHVAPELRETMFALARQQNQREPDQQKGEHRSELSRPTGQGVPGARPGDAWAAVTTWDEILEPHGWRRDHSTAESDRWTRPGKSSGTSATTDYNGSGLLYVFSSSTVFETGDEATYSKFGAYAQLNFDGDLEGAARDLADKGFADPLRAEADSRQQRVVQLAIQREMHLEADEVARRSRATRDMRIPPTRSMLDAINHPLPEPAQLVDRLVIGEGVTLLSAQNKTGKSTVGVNLVKSLLDGGDLFGQLATRLPTDAGVGVWNAEVSAATYERWMVEHGLSADHADRLTFFHMSGYAVDLMLPTWREQAVSWLRDHNVKLWLLDPLSKIYRGDENSATEVNAWWMAVREIMSQADVPAAFVIHHAGHTDDDKRARARGSSAIEGDPEVVLSYRHGGKPGNFPPDNRRYLSGVGRIDGVVSLTLDYDPETRTLAVDRESQGFTTDRQVHEDETLARAAWKLLDGAESKRDDGGAWVSKQQIKDADTGFGDKKTLECLSRCVSRGYLVVESTGNGKPDKVRRGARRPR